MVALVVAAGSLPGAAGQTQRVVSTATTVPGTAFPFSTLTTTPSAATSGVAFSGGNSFRNGIYFGAGSALTVIADTTTTVPGTSFAFSSLSVAAQASGSRVAFSGGNSFASGIYTGTGGGLSRIVDTFTTQPGSSFEFSSFNNSYFKLSGSTVAFSGGGTGASFGLYTGTGGTPTRVVDSNTVAPGGTTTFTSLQTLTYALSGSTVAFSAGTGTRVGLYTGSGGAVTRIVDTTVTVPGTSFTFSTLGTRPAYAGSAVAFFGGTTGRRGIYAGAGGSLTTIADTATTVPGTSSAFTDFGDTPSVSGAVVAFQGTGAGRIGVYSGTGGAVTRIADSATAVPGSSLAFTSFGPPQNVGANVYFYGNNSSAGGIYVGSGGGLAKVVALGDALDGSTITGLQTTFSLSDTRLTFEANLANGAVGIYTVPVPEPHHALAACAALAVLGRCVLARARTASADQPDR